MAAAVTFRRPLPSMATTSTGSGAMRQWRTVWMASAWMVACLLAGCASTGKEMSALDRVQYD